MQVFRRYLTIHDPKHVIIPDVPFHSGQRIEVLLFSTDDETKTMKQELQNLLKSTQTLPHSHVISENDIANEIKAYHEENKNSD